MQLGRYSYHGRYNATMKYNVSVCLKMSHQKRYTIGLNGKVLKNRRLAIKWLYCQFLLNLSKPRMFFFFLICYIANITRNDMVKLSFVYLWFRLGQPQQPAAMPQIVAQNYAVPANWSATSQYQQFTPQPASIIDPSMYHLVRVVSCDRCSPLFHL